MRRKMTHPLLPHAKGKYPQLALTAPNPLRAPRIMVPRIVNRASADVNILGEEPASKTPGTDYEAMSVSPGRDRGGWVWAGRT